MSLDKHSLLVKLTIRQWNGFRKDRKVSKRVDEEYQTSGGAGNYNKRLLDKAVLAPTQQIAARARADHKFFTMPWCYDGVDLLPSKLYFEYTERMRGHQDYFAVAVSNLVQQYPIHKANQYMKLGALFDPSEYPVQDELGNKFGFDVKFFPVPSTGHFVIDSEQVDMARVKEELTRSLSATHTAALEGLYARVNNTINHLYERLADPKNVFHDTLIDNVMQLVSVLPALNIFEDERLTRATREMEDKLFAVDVQRLRDDPVFRAKIANETQEISAILSGK